MAVTKICINCRSNFEVKNYKKQTAKFCSRSCTGKWYGMSHINNVGRPSWNKGKRKYTLECSQCYSVIKTSIKDRKFCNRKCDTQYKIDNNIYSKLNKGRVLSEEHKRKIGIASKIAMSNPEILKKALCRKDKSSLEVKFEDIVKRLNLPYKFVGNGEVIIARKCPDFIDSNGNRTAIEVYYRKHKEQFRNGLEEWKAERARIFNDAGWEIVFFDETQVNESNVASVLGGV